MSDPAIEAGRKVRYGHPLCVGDRHTDSCLVDAAREALAPLRELHKSTDYAYCRECEAEWPCDTARLIYPESEL